MNVLSLEETEKLFHFLEHFLKCHLVRKGVRTLCILTYLFLLCIYF